MINPTPDPSEWRIPGGPLIKKLMVSKYNKDIIPKDKFDNYYNSFTNQDKEQWENGKELIFWIEVTDDKQ